MRQRVIQFEQIRQAKARLRMIQHYEQVTRDMSQICCMPAAETRERPQPGAGAKRIPSSSPYLAPRLSATTTSQIVRGTRPLSETSLSFPGKKPHSPTVWERNSPLVLQCPASVSVRADPLPANRAACHHRGGRYIRSVAVRRHGNGRLFPKGQHCRWRERHDQAHRRPCHADRRGHRRQAHRRIGEDLP